MSKLKPAAFLSYVRFDDEHEDGRLSEFRKRLSGEVRMQTGEEFPIFQDRNDISWGQNWQKRIDDSIDHSTFLICILTPGFFKSVACRKEVERFVEREKKLGRADLILAVYYVECLQLRDRKQIEKDKIGKLVFTRQYVDWRELRFEPFTSAEAGKSLAQIASQIRDALQRPSGKSKDKRSAAPSRAERPPKPAASDLATQALGALVEVKRELEVPAQKTEAATRIVDSTGRGQHTAVSEAIAMASPGDRILIRPGVYREHLIVDKPLELVGDGKVEEIVLTASDSDVVSFQTTIGRIANVTIRQAQAKPDRPGYLGMAISQGRLILENCELFGTALYVIGVRGGSDPQITHNKIASENDEGCGILVSSSRGLIENNEINTNGFGIAVLYATAGPIVRQNVIRSRVVGVRLLEKSTVTVDDNDIAKCWLGVGASEGSVATVTRNRIRECQTGIRIDKASRAVLESNMITENAGNGIEILSGAQATISDNLVAQNGEYGIIASEDASVTLGENTFLENKSGDSKIEGPSPPK